MKKTGVTFLCTLLFLSCVSAQTEYTAIPDSAFEQTLLDLNIDSEGVLDGKVLTTDIVQVQDLSLSGLQNSTGIEAFTSLKKIIIEFSRIEDINFHNNTLLEEITIINTSLKAIDLQHNLALNKLVIGNYTEDVSPGVALSTLDLSKNTKLEEVKLYYIFDLRLVNLKNGHNQTIDFNSNRTPNLTCVIVDDVAFSNQNWVKDDETRFLSSETDCETRKKQIKESSIIRNKTNVATLVLDYTTNNFEGGNLSTYFNSDVRGQGVVINHYSNAKIPFEEEFINQGDFNTMKLSLGLDMVFTSTIIWSGVGQITIPKQISLGALFEKTTSKVRLPSDIQHYQKNMYESLVDEEFENETYEEKVAKVWDVISTYKVVNDFGNETFKAAVYFYPPSIGVFNPQAAKWVVFLYYTDTSFPLSVKPYESNGLDVLLYPNPANEKISIQTKQGFWPTSYTITDINGRVCMQNEMKIGSSNINIANLEAGIYYIELKNIESNIAIQKVIVKQ